MDAILGKLKLVEEGTQKATRLHESVAELDAQVSRVSARVPFVEKFEVRLNGLNALSADVDRKLEEQLARRTELDALKAPCDGLAAQMVDAQHKLDRRARAADTLVPLVAEVNTLRAEIGAAEERLDGTKFNEAAVVEQEKRYVELVTASRTVATEVAERTRQMQALSEELARSPKIKDEMLVELDRVQGRQRDTAGQIQASEDQLTRAESDVQAARAAPVAGGLRREEAGRRRVAARRDQADRRRARQEHRGHRQPRAAGQRGEGRSARTSTQISARSKADLTHVTEHRGEVATLKSQVDLLLSRIGETDERIVAIDAQRKLVDEVQTKANAIVHVLDDVRINLETLGEQKAVIDHVAEKVAQLEFTLQEARNTLRTLQHERELAERIEQGIKQLADQDDQPEDGKKSA